MLYAPASLDKLHAAAARKVLQDCSPSSLRTGATFPHRLPEPRRPSYPSRLLQTPSLHLLRHQLFAIVRHRANFVRGLRRYYGSVRLPASVHHRRAFYWQSPEGLNTWPYRYADKWISEDRLDQNPPRVARIYALIAAVQFDAFIASQDGKFTYWYIRPHQLDPSIVPLFPVPIFPSYPSNHSTFSAARTEVLAYLFPTRADFIRAVGKEAGDSRIWAGIHYQMDNLAGNELGKSVAQVFISRAQSDGSQ